MKNFKNASYTLSSFVALLLDIFCSTELKIYYVNWSAVKINADEPFRMLKNFQENVGIWLPNKSIRIAGGFSEYIELKRRQTI